MTMNEKKHSFTEIPITVWVIGMVTLLINLSSIMIFSLSPLYLTQVFGLATFHLGILEGIVEFTSWCIRIFSGVVSDYLHKRKPLLLFAYTLTALSRPIFALAPSIGWIYTAKLTDRISNGLQATPREALVGDVAPKGMKGACYGLRQSLGVIGSLLGASGVMILMRYTNNNYEFIFWLAGIPPLLALIAVIFFIKDAPPTPTENTANKLQRMTFSAQLKNTKNLTPAFWTVIFVGGIFMMSNFSGAYRILQAQRMGFPLADISIVMVLQNFGAMLSAFPIGKLSDTIDRRILLGFGFFITIASNLFMGFGGGVFGVVVGSALWGMQMGITQSILLTMVADTTSQDLRGTAFGIYYLVNAFALFIANTLTGCLFDSYSPTVAFTVSAAIAGAGLTLLPLIKPYPKKALATS